MRNAKLVVAVTPTSLLDLLGTSALMRNGTHLILQAQGGAVSIGNAAAQPYTLAVDQTLDIEGVGLKDTYIQGTAAVLVVR